MDILAKNLIPISNLHDFKIHFAVSNGDEQPLDVFVRDQQEWLGWNSWRGSRNDFSRQYIFSLIRYYHQSNRWLFGGIFEVVERKTDSYSVMLSDVHQEFIGRLLIDHPGAGARGRAFYLENYFDEFKVSQVFEESFQGEAFCGYENVEHGFSQLESIFKQSRPDWKSALENVKGVYLIVDKKNGKKYVGSAHGGDGIWSRWGYYLNTGHGGNSQLRTLIEAEGIEYARKNFQFSILEFRPMMTGDQKIIDREQYWKRVLLSNGFGYNAN